MSYEKLYHQSPRKSWKYERPEHGGGISGMQDPALERQVRARRFIAEAAKVRDLIPQQMQHETVHNLGSVTLEAASPTVQEVAPTANFPELVEHER